MLRLAALVTFVSLAGCTTTNSGADRAPLGDGIQPRTVLFQNTNAALTPAERTELDHMTLNSGLVEALEYCRPKLIGYQNESVKQAKQAYLLSLSGLVAGAVIAPALLAANATANAAWIATMSGWAGATNFAGQSLQTSGLSGTTSAQTHNALVTNVVNDVSIATDSTKSFPERARSILRVRASCTMHQIAVPTIPSNG